MHGNHEQAGRDDGRRNGPTVDLDKLFNVVKKLPLDGCDGSAQSGTCDAVDDGMHAGVDAAVDDRGGVEEQACLPKSRVEQGRVGGVGSLAHSPNPEVDVEGDADAVGRVGGRKAVLEVMCAHCETRDGRRVRAWNAKEILDSRREVDAKGKNIDETSSKPGTTQPENHGQKDEEEGMRSEERSVDKIPVQPRSTHETLMLLVQGRFFSKHSDNVSSYKGDGRWKVSIVDSIVLETNRGGELVFGDGILVGRFDVRGAAKKTDAFDLFVFLYVATLLVFGVDVRGALFGMAGVERKLGSSIRTRGGFDAAEGATRDFAVFFDAGRGRFTEGRRTPLMEVGGGRG